MGRLTIATVATGAPMGAQVYQEEIASRAAQALGAREPGWHVGRMIVRSMRSPLPGTRRLPMGFLMRAPGRVRRAAGALLYPRGGVVHRMNLELPPAPVEVITLHDIVSWRFPDESPPVAAAEQEARAAAAVICVSKFSAAVAVELLGIGEPHVVYNGVDDRFFDAEPCSASRLTSLGISPPYVLNAGGASLRKNLDGLAAAWRQVHRARPDLTLVLSGPEHPRRTALFEDLPRTRLLGRVDDALVPGLIAAAAAVVVPSHYEGFGLPALEAMAARVPVVAARTSALPEVVGDGGLLVAPDAEQIATGILAAVEGGADVAAMVAAGRRRAEHFTWERSAAGHAAVWADVAARSD